MRAGAFALSLLATPLNVHVLTALEEEPLSLVDLRRAVGAPPQTTLRGHLKALTDLGALERRRRSEFPGAVDFALGPAGRDLLGVGRVVDAWLERAPDGPFALGTVAAKSAIRALVDGWSSTIVRAIAAGPLSLTELDRLIPALNYPSLERRLAALRLSGQIEARPGRSRGTPYAASIWLREAVAPLAAAVGWELRNSPERSSPVGRLDVESAFLLALPLAQLPDSIGGRTRLAVEVRPGSDEHAHAGVVVAVEDGRITSCLARLQGNAEAWASGRAAAWLAAVIDGDADALEVGGDCDLARSVIDGLGSALFSSARPIEGHPSIVPDS